MEIIIKLKPFNFSLTTESPNDTWNSETDRDIAAVSTWYVVVFTALFFAIGIVGTCGNVLVIYVICRYTRMRKSVTNLLIANLAIADLLILLFGVPEIVQFMINRGWLLGTILCKAQRTVLVTALYASVMTLVALCIER